MGHRRAGISRRGRAASRPAVREWRRVVGTAIGAVVVLWRGDAAAPVVTRICLPGESPPAGRRRAGPPSRSKSCARIDELSARLRAFCAGEDVVFDLSVVDLDRCGPFQRAVLRAEHGIPRGSVSTYGRIAARIGHPGASRAVGTALARNPFPLVVPCHRAVREGGALGRFRGGAAMKRRLLEMEGVAFTERGRVVPGRYHYDTTPRSVRGAPSKRKERR